MITFSLELMWWLSACHGMKQEGNTGQMEGALCEKPGSWEGKRITNTFPQDSTDSKYKLKTYASSLLLLLLLQLCTVSISFYIEEWCGCSLLITVLHMSFSMEKYLYM